jgi:hypothetical protein
MGGLLSFTWIVLVTAILFMLAIIGSNLAVLCKEVRRCADALEQAVTLWRGKGE